MKQFDTIGSLLAYFTLQNMLQSYFGYFLCSIPIKKEKWDFLHSLSTNKELWSQGDLYLILSLATFYCVIVGKTFCSIWFIKGISGYMYKNIKK